MKNKSAEKIESLKADRTAKNEKLNNLEKQINEQTAIIEIRPTKRELEFVNTNINEIQKEQAEQ